MEVRTFAEHLAHLARAEPPVSEVLVATMSCQRRSDAARSVLSPASAATSTIPASR
ncbi:hypothetical protein ACIBCU_21535 [Streptomyces sp. NPDC051064]|uniref:hypothetical protein n=1 Tax=Streptomyces sp. NPDC051064 TaxID=3365641 RepID=UPI00378AA29D